MGEGCLRLVDLGFLMGLEATGDLTEELDLHLTLVYKVACCL
jgi:hypothetical protein